MSGSMRPFQGFVGIDVSRDKFDDCGIREDHLVDDDASHPLLWSLQGLLSVAQEGWTALQKGRLATAQKLIRVIYALLKQRTAFCPVVNS